MDVNFPNIRHLRVFLEVARSHSISIAAGRAHLSQPAVTQAIAKLEADLQVALFMRKNVGFHTTEIGTQFVLRVERALKQLRNGARLGHRTGSDQKPRGFSNFDELVTSAQLRALVAVGEAGSYSVAARDIKLSQPSVHRSVSNLENLSGLQLFRRISTGIEPTSAGNALIKHTKLAHSEIQQGLNEISEFRGRDTTEIIVGSLPLARTHILPKAVHAMIKSSDSVQVRVIDGPYSELLRRLRTGEIDFMIGALRDPPPAPDISQETLFMDPLAIVAGPNHPLAKKAEVTIEETLLYPWVAPPKITPAGSYLYDVLQIHNMPTTPVRAVSSSLVFLRGLMAQDHYLTIISRHQIQEEQSQGLMVPLDIELSDSARPIGITLRSDWQPTATQARFLGYLRKYGAEAGRGTFGGITKSYRNHQD
ncbi:MAG: LysR family transcriptional regulator [Rhodobacteraceae bacterium]|nr:LysR family transcriptional regulator [Paracoccaceae bacterium]